MGELLRQSGLMREEWNQPRGDRTYGELTIAKAIQFVDEYSPVITRELELNEPKEQLMSARQSDTNTTTTGGVDTVEEPSSDAVYRAGRIQDDTAAVRFVI